VIANENRFITHLAEQLRTSEFSSVCCIRWFKRTKDNIIISHWNSWCRSSEIDSPSWTLTGDTGFIEVGLDVLDSETKMIKRYKQEIDPSDKIELRLHEDQSIFSERSFQFAVELRKNGEFLMAYDIFGKPYQIKG